MSLLARLKRLELSRGGWGCGPGCPPQVFIRYFQDGYDGERLLEEGQKPPTPCPRCGRPAETTPIVLTYDPDFYGNAARLRELTT
jgi:hypothetical protein